MPETTNGRCQYCRNIFSKRTIRKHLEKCEARQSKIKETGGETERFFTILVEGSRLLNYWIYLDVSAKRATLKDLDKFLRDIWLECCGHLSQFIINREYFTISSERDYGEHSMNYKLENVLEVGTTFKHEYDFGSTTELRLKVLAECQGIKRKKKIELMARNLPPEIKCVHCGNQAAYICAECMWDGMGELCGECATEHGCGEEMLLPVCNSPRCGVCGYEGGVYGED